jgi:hypothetical protein
MAGEKSRKKRKIRTDFTGPPMGDEIIRSHLHGFGGGIWPARGGWGEKMRKNVRKKTKKFTNMRKKLHERYLAGPKMNAD